MNTLHPCFDYLNESKDEFEEGKIITSNGQVIAVPTVPPIAPALKRMSP
jgi:hypothetical protein